MAGAKPQHVSELAKKRQRGEMGTLGSGNHYLEVQVVDRIHDAEARARMASRKDRLSYPSTAARAGSATRSAPITSSRWRRQPGGSACGFPTASSRARRSIRLKVSNISAR